MSDKLEQAKETLRLEALREDTVPGYVRAAIGIVLDALEQTQQMGDCADLQAKLAEATQAFQRIGEDVLQQAKAKLAAANRREDEHRAEIERLRAQCDGLTKGTVNCSECREHDSVALGKLRERAEQAEARLAKMVEAARSVRAIPGPNRTREDALYVIGHEEALEEAWARLEPALAAAESGA